MTSPAIFLETTIQIERVVAPASRQRQLQEELASYRILTSTYVLGEYLRTLVKDAVQLHRVVAQYAYVDEVITDLGQHPNKGEASRMTLLLGTLLRQTRRLQSILASQTHGKLQLQLAYQIEFGLLDQFYDQVDEIVDSTACGLAQERPKISAQSADHTAGFRLRSQCLRHVRECDLAERMAAWRPELQAVAEGLAQERDPSLIRMGQLARQILEDPVVARGRNCTWYLGDLVIALELPAAVPLYTTNQRHFAPLLKILGKQLHVPLIPVLQSSL